MAPWENLKACPHCGARLKVVAAKSKFDPHATRAENIRDHGELAPWQLRKKRKSMRAPVAARVEFTDGTVRRASTYFVNAAGEPDTDAVVRAEREALIATACQRNGRWYAQGYEPADSRRPDTTELTDNTGRTRRYYLAQIPGVKSVRVEPQSPVELPLAA